MDRFRDEQILDVVARVKAGQAHPGDVEALTQVAEAARGQHPALAAMIDDALSETDWITEAEKAGAVPTMRPPTADGFGGVPPNMGPMTDGRFDYLPTAQQEAQDRADAAARLFELQQQNLPPGTPPMPGGSPFDAVGVMQAAQGPPGGLGAMAPAAPPPTVARDPHTNWLEEKNRQGGILGGQPTGDWASGLKDLLGGAIGPAPPSPEKGQGTVRIGTPDPLWMPFADASDPAVAAAAAGDHLPTAGSAATANVSPFAMPGQEAVPDYGEDPTLPPPDRGGAHKNNVARGTDWRAERDARRAARGDMGGTLGLPEDSAFYGVSTDLLHELPYQTDLMARMIAEKMGGGAMTAAMIAPEVQSAQALVNAGALGGGPKGSGLGPELSDTDQLQMIEAFVRQGASQTGVQIDPYKAYKGGMKRALDTSEEALQKGADEQGGRMAKLNQQIKITQDALLSGSGGMGPGAENKLRSRLDKAASDWLLETMKLPPEQAVTYPQYLKQIKAQKWFR